MHEPETGCATKAAALVQRYIDMWNETDAGRRRVIAGEILAENVVYQDPVMAGDGPDGVSAMIGEAQRQFSGLRFSVRGAPEATGDCLRFSWTLAPPGEAPVVAGSDFAILGDGRFTRITGFIDQAPGAPPVN